MRHHPLARPAAAVGLAVALALPLALAPAPVEHPAAASATPSAPQPPTGATAAEAGTDIQAEIAAAGTDAAPGGPRPTSLRLSDDDVSTTVLVHGLGSAATAQSRENRSYRHSDFQPTARFTAEGDELTITVPEGAPAMSVSIGLRGLHGEQNGGVERDRWTTPLAEGTNTVTSPLDGMVHLISTVEGGSADVVVEGGQAVPHFVAGQTTNEDLRAEMARLTEAPFVQVIGDRFFGDFQARKTGTVIRVADMEARVAEMDRAIEITNHAYGLLDDGTGLARKAPHRVYVAAPDISGGYANAGDERVTFPVSSGAAGDLFRAPSWDQWGWWHEIGHTYQTPTINWSGQGEVFVNMSALHVQTAMGWAPRLDQQAGGFDAFFARPVADRSYMGEGNVFVRLFLYDQLRRGFGDEFWPRLNQELRAMKARGEIASLDAEGQRQLFARTAARVADRDLTEFFRQWGFALNDDTRAAMDGLPALEQPIWQNRHSSNLIREYEMTPYEVPVVEVSTPTESVVVGQRQLTSPPALVGFGDSDGEGDVRVVDHVISTLTPGTGSVTVTVANDLGVREVFTTPVEVTPGTSVQFRGAYDRVVAALAVPRDSDELRLIAGTTYQSHANFGHDEYVGATVHDARGRQTASFSVTGYETAHPAARAFDGTRFTDGMYLTIRHREANSRSTRWDDGTQASRNAATTQHYRYDAGHLVPVAAIPVTSALDAVPATDPLTLRRGTTTDGTITLETTERITGLDADLVVTAPARTTLDTEEAPVTEVRLPGGDWVTATDIQVTSTPGADGTTATLSMTGRDGLDLPTGTQLRWAVGITVPTHTHTIGTGLTWTITGTAQGETIKAHG